MKPTLPITAPTFTWHNEASHSDPMLFRVRMYARRIEAQTKPRTKAHATPAGELARVTRIGRSMPTK